MVIVDHELRFTPAYLRARQHLREGTIGAVLVVEANVLYPVPTRNFTWWADASKGGGVLGAIGSHVFDAFRRVPVLDKPLSSADVFCCQLGQQGLLVSDAARRCP